MQKKNKVKVTIMLDPDVKEESMHYLANMGMSLSSFVNLVLAQYLEELKGSDLIPDKPMKDLTLDEFGKLMSFWVQKASE